MAFKVLICFLLFGIFPNDKSITGRRNKPSSPQCSSSVDFQISLFHSEITYSFKKYENFKSNISSPLLDFTYLLSHPFLKVRFANSLMFILSELVIIYLCIIITVLVCISCFAGHITQCAFF